MKRWYAEKGYPAALLETHFETFIRKTNASGAKYADWDEAFMNCIADDWGDVRRNVVGFSRQAVPATSARKNCAYCPKVAVGNINGLDHCSDHSTDAMDQRPRLKVAA